MQEEFRCRDLCTDINAARIRYPSEAVITPPLQQHGEHAGRWHLVKVCMRLVCTCVNTPPRPRAAVQWTPAHRLLNSCRCGLHVRRFKSALLFDVPEVTHELMYLSTSKTLCHEVSWIFICAYLDQLDPPFFDCFLDPQLLCINVFCSS